MDFEIIAEISNIETIAKGQSVRDRFRLRRIYGGRRWQKRKGTVEVKLHNGRVRIAEVHWYEAHGKREFKLKLPFLDKQ